jgi:ATP-dependent DNA helicase RecQ
MEVLTAKDALKKYFGYDSFRPMQEEIIQTVYDKKDALVLMPTGGGKSICYQIPAITMDGICIVVSPLISLMKDQVESLKASGVNAAFLNSSLSSAEQKEVEDDLFYGKIKLLYVSPEKMVSQSFQPLLKQTKVNLFAIDEAHCISSWGHDFRPEYTKLKFLKTQFPNVPVIALTATADKITRRDIVRQLTLSEPKIFIASFDRPNLSLTVRPGQKKIQQILDFIKLRPNQSGIIYCLSRKNTEKVAEKLNASGIKAAFYHAGIDSAKRSKVQEDFINDNVPVVCATIAFGMGIDKSNVRWVIHHNLPKNIEGYYQEIGRSGRDGADADTLLFYSFGDVMVLRDIIQSNKSENVEVQLSKLERMQQFAESLICRRKILLGYFGETLQNDCGNCDVCKNPPKSFDGTVIAQKALSAIVRLNEKVGVGMLIDVLRGSKRQEILQNGFEKIKTYGAGADISFADWQQLIYQLINFGYIEIAYDKNNTLKLTEAAKDILFKKQKVQLVKITDIKQRQELQRAQLKQKSKRQRVRDELFEKLRQLRKQLAQKKGVPPYLIFSDASLEEMAATRPTNESEMANISGVGEVKLKQFGKSFIKEIIDFIGEKSVEGVKIHGTTQLLTYQLYKRGFSAEQIAVERDLSLQTVHDHLVKMYAKDEGINISHFVKKSEINKIVSVLQNIASPYKLKDIFDQLNGEIPYYQIRFALAYYYKHEGQ